MVEIGDRQERWYWTPEHGWVGDVHIVESWGVRVVPLPALMKPVHWLSHVLVKGYLMVVSAWKDRSKAAESVTDWE